MSEIDFRSALFDAYQKTAEHLLPPGFVLVGERIVQTVGNVQQLFLDQLHSPTEMTLTNLPPGVVKQRLVNISKSVVLNIPFDKISSFGIRVSPFRWGGESEEPAILVVFDLSSWSRHEMDFGSRSDQSHPVDSPHVGSEVINDGADLEVSELRQTQADLKQSTARFERAALGSSIGILEFDSERPDWLFADHIENLLEFERGELNNSRTEIRKLIHPDDREKNDGLRENLKSGFDSWKDLRQELRLKNKHGEYRWFEVFSQKVARCDGKPGRAGTIVDINQLKTGQLRAAQQVRLRDEFLAMLSHELRNPMAAIVLGLDLLMTSGSVPPENQSAIDIINRQSNQISRLLDDLLDVSRVTHNRIEFQMSPVDVNVIVKEVVSGFINSAGQKFLTLNTELCDHALVVEGDETRLRQVVSNLLENALKFTGKNGEIWVSTSRLEESALISIRDTGMGIPDEVIGQVFDLFTQGNPNESRTQGGLGVGLFLVKHIVNAHGGVVVAKSNGPGEGSQFEFRIPLSANVTSRDGTKRQHALDGLNVALVEDSHDSRFVVTELLELNGMNVTEFVDGESASEAIPRLRPDVAIIDIGLPGKSGLDLAREIRSNRALDATLLIALTGYGQGSDKEMAKEAGFDVHLVKPTDIGKLSDAIAENSSVVVR